MLTARLKRVSTHPIQGTFGVLVVGAQPICATLEPYKRDNAKSLSCIPTGQYICHRVISPKFGDTFEVTDVQGRSHILFHKGNRDHDSSGCILVGEEFGFLGNDWAVLSSGRAFDEFMSIFKNEDAFHLTIEEVY